jgi:RNA recognition motif-containing protein
MRQAGEVLVHAQIITEFNTGRSKGYGIVEYATDEEAQKAITTLTDSAVPLSNPVVVE